MSDVTLNRRTLLKLGGAVAVAGAVQASTSSAAHAGPASDNTPQVWDYFIRRLSPEATAGIIGNLVVESASTWIDPQAYEQGGSRIGRGIAQWNVGQRWDTDYHANVVYYTETLLGLSRWSLSGQMQFLWWELQNHSWLGLGDLRAAGTVSDATSVFMWEFEQPPSDDTSFDRRYTAALNAYNRFIGGSTTPSTSTTLPHLYLNTSGGTLGMNLKRWLKLMFTDTSQPLGYYCSKIGTGDGWIGTDSWNAMQQFARNVGLLSSTGTLTDWGSRCWAAAENLGFDPNKSYPAS